MEKNPGISLSCLESLDEGISNKYKCEEKVAGKENKWRSCLGDKPKNAEEKMEDGADCKYLTSNGCLCPSQ